MNFLRNVLIYAETYIRQHLLGQVSRYLQAEMTTISILGWLNPDLHLWKLFHLQDHRVHVFSLFLVHPVWPLPHPRPLPLGWVLISPLFPPNRFLLAFFAFAHSDEIYRFCHLSSRITSPLELEGLNHVFWSAWAGSQIAFKENSSFSTWRGDGPLDKKASWPFEF